MSIINRDSFEATGTESHTWKDGTVSTYEVGTVVVTLGGESRRLGATRNKYGDITVRGLGGRYLTSAKVWPASVYSSEDGRESAFFGRDDRSGRFNKLRGVFFINEEGAQ